MHFQNNITSICIYIFKYTFYRFLFFLKLVTCFFLFSYLYNINYYYSKCFLLNCNFIYNIINNYDLNSYIYSNFYSINNFQNYLFNNIDFYDIKFDQFFYSFIQYKNPDAIFSYNRATAFKYIYLNSNFSYYYSISFIFDYKIGINVVKLIHSYLIDSFNLNMYTDWIINKHNIYFIYNLNKQLYLMKYNSFFIQNKLFSFFNISIENFF